MNKKVEIYYAYSGFLFMALLAAGIFCMTSWFRPMDPAWTPAQVQQIFIAETTRIRIGASLLLFGSVFLWPFSAAISTQMKRMEGDSHPLATLQLVSSSGTVIPILLVSFLWLTIAYRPQSYAPATMQMLNDYCWMTFVGVYPTGMIEFLAIGLCILWHPERSVYPAWLGVMNIVFALLFVLAAVLPFVTGGPFAWNGLLGYYLPASVFFIWLVLMPLATIRAIKATPATERRARPTYGPSDQLGD